MNKEVSPPDEYSQANQKATVISPTVTVIFPAKNEESTIEGVISVVSESTFDPDIMVVDAYSSDKTVELAVKAGATVIQQPEQVFPGKGIAMKAGLRKVISDNTTSPADIILFLDSDIKNLTADWVDKLVTALLEGRCDMSRGFYQRQPRDAAVTKLIARPMLNVFFPEVSHFEQPLSGEVCARRHLWETLLRIEGSPDGWGIDIWFLIESAMQGHSIKEVFMGSKEHASFEDYREDVGKLSKMAEQVEFTIIREAIKYDRLDLESTVKV
ncbi:MAG TPA: glycosyltransferase [Nitrososphaeraceae archaeon]|nr:glycosyltransferase [Nitrososphaeraceae archaeon]